jgi:cytochrome c oxidase subunit II
MRVKPIRPRRGPIPGWAPAGGLLSLLLVLAGCADEYPQSSISPHSDFAEIIHALYVDIFWWTMLILGVVWVLMGYVLVRFRARPGDPKPRQIRGHMGLEIGWTVGPALIVVAIAIPTIQAVFATQRPLSDDALRVEVTGHQFWWEFHYPAEGVTTANELWLPVDRPVNMRLGSTDVIHSFWVPKLGGKRDVNPVVAVREGEEPEYNWLYFTPNQTGLYMGQCAEFCGEAHASMAMRVVVESEDGFQDWIQAWHTSQGAAGPGAGPPAMEIESLGVAGAPVEPEEEAQVPMDEGDDPLVAMGREIFLSQSTCVACHAIQGTSAAGAVGPNLTLFGLRTTLGAGIRENNQENLVSWIQDPHGMKPGAAMPGTDTPGGNWPPTNLTEDQVQAVAAYLLSLK